MFAFGHSFESLGKHFNLEPDVCRMIAVDKWEQWTHYYERAHELYRTEQAFLLVTQAITMLHQTTDPKGFTALLRVILNFFRIPFGRKKKSPPPRATHPVTPASPMTSMDAEYDDDDDDDGWEIPEHIVAATRELVAQRPSSHETTPYGTADREPPPVATAPTEAPGPLALLFSDAEMKRFVDVYRAEPETFGTTLQRDDPVLYAKCVAFKLIPAPPVATKPSRRTWRQQLHLWLHRFGLRTHPPDH